MVKLQEEVEGPGIRRQRLDPLLSELYLLAFKVLIWHLITYFFAQVNRFLHWEVQRGWMFGGLVFVWKAIQRAVCLQILDRKNGEIEEIKSTYRAKQKESEEVIVKLEKKGERWRGPSLYMEDVYTVVSAHSALRGRFQRGPVGRDDLQLCGPKSQNRTFTVWFSSPCSFVTPPFCFCSPLEAISWEKCLCSDAPLSSVP